MKIPRKYYIWLVAGIIILIAVEYLKPEKINWNRTYSTFDNIPFGTNVLFELIPDLFPEKSIERINKTFYDYSIDNFFSDYSLIYINENINFSDIEQKALLNYVNRGYELFISAKNITESFTDTLGVKIEKKYLYGKNKSHKLILNNKEAFIDTISKIPTINYQSEINILKESKYKITVLDSSGGRNNFVCIEYGNGSIFLHTEPLVFTNYYILKEYSTDYCQEALMQMKVKNIVWSDYPNNGLRTSLNPLRYILKTDAYRYGYYVLLVLIVLYIGLAGKRKQRVIPVINPHVNSTVDFVQTISNLYLSNKNNKKIALHRINYFRNYLRTNYFIDWKLSEDEIIQKLGNKTGKGQEKVKSLLKYIQFIEVAKTVDQEQLLKLNKEIDYFILK